jgi:S1-C subfamily serine protease
VIVLSRVMFLWAIATAMVATAQTPSLSELSRAAQQRVVKIYGAGGAGGLDTYQSGFLVSPIGHIATAWSPVLDVPPIIRLNDGARYEAEVVDFEPALELAVLKINASDLPYFELDTTIQPGWGQSVLAVSNLFNIATANEPASVMQGLIAAIAPLDARRGTFQTVFKGDVLILDLVANNPGAAGGAVVNGRGQLVGMLGKELRDSSTGVWLNYAIPLPALKSAIGDIIVGRRRVEVVADNPPLARDKSHDPADLGIVMVPHILENTPAFVDAVNPGSPAEEAGLRPDDLILMIGSDRIDGQETMRGLLRRMDRRDDVSLTIQRANDILTLNVRPD